MIVAILILSSLAFILVTVEEAEGYEEVLTRIIKTCAWDGDDPSSCYESEVPALYPGRPLPEVFDIIRDVVQKDSSYQFCHVLAHKIGERVVAEDPARWIDAIPLNPRDGLCSNGFIHGVIGGRFRSEVLSDVMLNELIPDFSRACEARKDWKPSDLDRAICYHGLGHLYDYITDANLGKALSLCERTTSSQFRRVCVEGVFMQIYQPLEPDDYLLIERMAVRPGTTTVRQFCAPFKDPEYVGACLRESWPFFRKDIMNGDGIEAFCSAQSNDELEEHCYRSAFTIVGRLALATPESAALACVHAPTGRQEMCYSVLAQTVLEEDRANVTGALALCARAPSEIAGTCVQWLIHQASFIFGSNTEEYTQFCKELAVTGPLRCPDVNRVR